MSPRSVVAALKMDLKAFSRTAGGGVVPLHFDAKQKNNLSSDYDPAGVCGRPWLFDFPCVDSTCRPGFKTGFPPQILIDSKCDFASPPKNESGEINLQGETTCWLETSQRVNERATDIDQNAAITDPASSNPHGTVHLFSNGVRTRRCKPARSATQTRRLPPSLDRSHPFQAHAITLAAGHHV